jgi:hypothetical protein
MNNGAVNTFLAKNKLKKSELVTMYVVLKYATNTIQGQSKPLLECVIWSLEM